MFQKVYVTKRLAGVLFSRSSSCLKSCTAKHFPRSFNENTCCHTLSSFTQFHTSVDRQIAPNISIKPSEHLLVDESLQIKINNLKRTQKVTVYAYQEEEGKKYESCGSFKADETGTVNLSKHKSSSGTYTGVSSMGLFWSMVPCPGQMEGIRMMKKNLDTPFTTVVKVFNGHVSLDEVKDKTLQEIGSTTVERWYKHPEVTCYEVEEGSVRGKLYLPPGPGPFPGVIDMFGTVGGITEFRSALLASRGIASLALSYFLYKDLPTNMFELSLDYFLEAVDWLISHEKIIKTGIGVIGVSKGGDLALMMAAHSPKVRAVVNINGCTFNAYAPLKYSGGAIPEVPFQFGKFIDKDGKYVINQCFEYTAADIIHNHNPKVLNILSEDDDCNPKECIRLLKEIYPKDKTENCIVLAYPGAGHLVEPPYTPLCNMSYHKTWGMYLSWGGEPDGHAFAQEDSWRRILELFHQELTIPTAAAKL